MLRLGLVGIQKTFFAKTEWGGPGWGFDEFVGCSTSFIRVVKEETVSLVAYTPANKLLLFLFWELLSLSSVANSRGDFCSFVKFSGKFKSEDDAFCSSWDFWWHFEDCNEPFDIVVLRRRLDNSGSDSKRYRTKLSVVSGRYYWLVISERGKRRKRFVLV